MLDFFTLTLSTDGFTYELVVSSIIKKFGYVNLNYFFQLIIQFICVFIDDSICNLIKIRNFINFQVKHNSIFHDIICDVKFGIFMVFSDVEDKVFDPRPEIIQSFRIVFL